MFLTFSLFNPVDLYYQGYQVNNNNKTKQKQKKKNKNNKNNNNPTLSLYM